MVGEDTQPHTHSARREREKRRETVERGAERERERASCCGGSGQRKECSISRIAASNIDQASHNPLSP